MIKKFLYYIILLLLLIFITLIYSRFVGVTGLNTNEILIKSNDIDTGYNGLKIVQFSDVHYKKIINEERIKELVNEINAIKPDVVIFNGDLFDNDYKVDSKDIDFLIHQLSKINSKYGKYSILGDADYSNIDTVKNIYIQSDFNLLCNDGAIVYNESNQKIFIGGVESSANGKANIKDVMKYFDENEDIKYKILLVHEGDYIDDVLNDYNFNLILGGHSINGSVNVPLVKNILLPRGGKKFYNNYYKVNNTDIYISNGIGVNNVNFRLFNTPSINYFRIKKTS